MTSSAEPDLIAAYFAQLDHPRKVEAEELCQLILAAVPGLRSGLKWNAPSFGWAGLDDWLTLRLHPAPAFQLVLHRGAKPMAHPPAQPQAAKGLVQWKSPDRGVVDFSKCRLDDLRGDLVALIRAWMAAQL